ncbi:hypothetical protein N7486_001076 [Penicillium sp. IBT 16267x]|nr:hypothetical protein N7486_001076 [Penicillium sp. IBT 16267x]
MELQNRYPVSANPVNHRKFDEHMQVLQHLPCHRHCLEDMPLLDCFDLEADDADGSQNDTLGTGFPPSASGIDHMAGVHRIFPFAACRSRKPSGDGKNAVGGG